MNKSEFLEELVTNWNEPTFDYNGKPCGIALSALNGVYTFTMWYGDKTKKYSEIDELMTDKFFDNLSLTDILPELDIWF